MYHTPQQLLELRLHLSDNCGTAYFADSSYSLVLIVSHSVAYRHNSQQQQALTFFCPSSATARHHCTRAAYVCCQLRDNSAAASFLRSFSTVSPQREAALSIFSFCTLPQQCYSSPTLNGSCAAVTSSYPHHHVTIRIVGNIGPSTSLPSATTAACSSA